MQTMNRSTADRDAPGGAVAGGETSTQKKIGDVEMTARGFERLTAAGFQRIS